MNIKVGIVGLIIGAIIGYLNMYYTYEPIVNVAITHCNAKLTQKHSDLCRDLANTINASGYKKVMYTYD